MSPSSTHVQVIYIYINVSLQYTCPGDIYILMSPSSTHVQVTDCEGQFVVRTSCGTEGFKNIKKSTPIAAQTAGISAAAVR
jgi:ribosomal protein S11